MDKYSAKELNRMAKAFLSLHDEKCNGVILNGCPACDFRTGYDNGPLVNKWALPYVCAEEPIPQDWRSAFIDELNHADPKYRSELEEAINWFGVRWQ